MGGPRKRAGHPDKGTGPRIHESTGKRLDPKSKRRRESLQAARERACAAALTLNRRLRLKGVQRLRWAVGDAP
jgi:hypothetical protein